MCTRVFVCPQLPTSELIENQIDLTKPHRVPIESIRASALNDCTICERIWDKIQDSIPPRRVTNEGSPSPELQDVVVIDKSPLLLLKEPTKPPTLELGPENYIPTQQADLNSSSTPSDSARNPGSSSTRSLQTLLLAKTWLQNCIENHSSCARAADSKSPTHLLQIRYPDPNHVCVTATSSLRGRHYVTLSHCWG